MIKLALFVFVLLVRGVAFATSQDICEVEATSPTLAHRQRVVQTIRIFVDENIKQRSNRFRRHVLADRAGVSLRDLNRCFISVVGLAPAQFVLSRKLEAVHEGLLHPRNGETVAQVALEYGFTELGRFSGYYKKKFGELPSATLQRGLKSNAEESQ